MTIDKKNIGKEVDRLLFESLKNKYEGIYKLADALEKIKGEGTDLYLQLLLLGLDIEAMGKARKEGVIFADEREKMKRLTKELEDFIHKAESVRFVLETVEGDKYIGKTKDGLYEDENAEIIYPDGSMYKGSFRKGKFDGQGKLTDKKSGDYRVGKWQAGKFVEGEVKITKGKHFTFYEGGFKNGAPNGKGEFTDLLGNRYKGEYESGKKQGKGELKKMDGSIFSGIFKNDEFIRGRAIDKFGKIFEGDFKNWVLHGKGKAYGKDGDILKSGEWEKGALKKEFRRPPKLDTSVNYEKIAEGKKHCIFDLKYKNNPEKIPPEQQEFHLETTLGTVDGRTDYGGKGSKYYKEKDGKIEAENQDSLFAVADEDSLTVGVVDGVGGGGKGHLAGQLINEALSKVVEKTSNKRGLGVIKEAFSQAQEKVVESGYAGEAAAAAALVKIENSGHAQLGWQGDSKVMTVRAGRKLADGTTTMQNFAAKQVEEGQVESKEFYNHPYNNVVMGAIGSTSEQDSPPEYKTFKVKNGDQIVLASDGLWDIVSEYEVEQLAQKFSGQRLQQALYNLAYERGNANKFIIQHDENVQVPVSQRKGDNIAIAVVEVETVQEEFDLSKVDLLKIVGPEKLKNLFYSFGTTNITEKEKLARLLFDDKLAEDKKKRLEIELRPLGLKSYDEFVKVWQDGLYKDLLLSLQNHVESVLKQESQRLLHEDKELKELDKKADKLRGSLDKGTLKQRLWRGIRKTVPAVGVGAVGALTMGTGILALGASYAAARLTSRVFRSGNINISEKQKEKNRYQLEDIEKIMNGIIMGSVEQKLEEHIKKNEVIAPVNYLHAILEKINFSKEEKKAEQIELEVARANLVEAKKEESKEKILEEAAKLLIANLSAKNAEAKHGVIPDEIEERPFWKKVAGEFSKAIKDKELKSLWLKDKDWRKKALGYAFEGTMGFTTGVALSAAVSVGVARRAAAGALAFTSGFGEQLVRGELTKREQDRLIKNLTQKLTEENEAVRKDFQKKIEQAKSLQKDKEERFTNALWAGTKRAGWVLGLGKVMETVTDSDWYQSIREKIVPSHQTSPAGEELHKVEKPIEEKPSEKIPEEKVGEHVGKATEQTAGEISKLEVEEPVGEEWEFEPDEMVRLGIQEEVQVRRGDSVWKITGKELGKIPEFKDLSQAHKNAVVDHIKDVYEQNPKKYISGGSLHPGKTLKFGELMEDAGGLEDTRARINRLTPGNPEANPELIKKREEIYEEHQKTTKKQGGFIKKGLKGLKKLFGRK